MEAAEVFSVVVLTVVCLICGVVSGMLMRNKGRSLYGGIALGLFLGPVGFAVALMAPESHEHRAERAEAEEQIRLAVRRRQFRKVARQQPGSVAETEDEMRARIRVEERQRLELELHHEQEERDREDLNQ